MLMAFYVLVFKEKKHLLYDGKHLSTVYFLGASKIVAFPSYGYFLSTTRSCFRGKVQYVSYFLRFHNATES